MKIIQKLTGLLLVAFFIMTVVATDVEAKKLQAKPQEVHVTVNNETVKLFAYNLNGKFYFRLEELSKLLENYSSRFTYKWNEKKNILTIIPNKTSTEEDKIYNRQPSPTSNIVSQKTKVVHNEKSSTITMYSIKDKSSESIIGFAPSGELLYAKPHTFLYVQLNDFASILNIKVKQDVKVKKVTIQTEPLKEMVVLEHTNSTDNLKSYYHSRWALPITQYIFDNNDGTISTLQVGSKIQINTYDKNYKRIAEKSIPIELSYFGTFYSGKQYNYIAYGKRNKDEKNIEVIRIVKYDKQFNRIAGVAIKADDITTTIPFDASSGGRMTEQGNTLVFHTSRQNYKSGDGLNHQTQLTIELDTNTMKVTNELEEFQWNHVSHSFDQYVLTDGQTPVYLSHGDGFPRGLILIKRQEMDGKMQLAASKFFNVPGDVGANVTGVSIGGFEQSTSHYLVSFNSINQNDSYTYTSYEAYDLAGNVIDTDKRNVYVYAIPKNFDAEGKTAIKKTTLMNYEKTKKYTATPALVKVNDDKFVVLWQEYSDHNNSEKQSSLKYVNINGQGEMTSQIYTTPSNYQLSTVQPIVKNNHIIWTIDRDFKKVLLRLPIK